MFQPFFAESSSSFVSSASLITSRDLNITERLSDISYSFILRVTLEVFRDCGCEAKLEIFLFGVVD